jgi:uncharacterized membrane protein YcaP (DUF421 family)
MEALSDVLDNLLGLSLESHDLEWHHMAIRAVVVYVVVLAITRSGHKRFLGKGTAFDVIIGILLGSIASRAITGNAAFFPALVACAVLVWLHAVFAWSAYRFRPFARAIEGDAVTVIREGEKVTEALKDSDVTDDDLQEALYNRGVSDVKQVEIARLERNGQISVVKKTNSSSR